MPAPPLDKIFWIALPVLLRIKVYYMIYNIFVSKIVMAD